MITVTKEMMEKALTACRRLHPDREPSVSDIAEQVRVLIREQMTPEREAFLKETLKDMQENYGKEMGNFGTGIDVEPEEEAH